MKKIERILAAAGFVVGMALLGLGIYKDKNPSEGQNYVTNTIIKGVGLVSLSASAGLAFRGLVEMDDIRYFEENKKTYSL